jgi:hypothetical protein
MHKKTGLLHHLFKYIALTRREICKIIYIIKSELGYHHFGKQKARFMSGIRPIATIYSTPMLPDFHSVLSLRLVLGDLLVSVSLGVVASLVHLVADSVLGSIETGEERR